MALSVESDPFDWLYETSDPQLENDELAKVIKLDSFRPSNKSDEAVHAKPAFVHATGQMQFGVAVQERLRVYGTSSLIDKIGIRAVYGYLERSDQEKIVLNLAGGITSYILAAHVETITFMDPSNLPAQTNDLETQLVPANSVVV